MGAGLNVAALVALRVVDDVGFHVMLLIILGYLLVLLGEAHAKKHEHDDAYCGDDE